jgi:hypothetical protein
MSGRQQTKRVVPASSRFYKHGTCTWQIEHDARRVSNGRLPLGDITYFVDADVNARRPQACSRLDRSRGRGADHSPHARARFQRYQEGLAHGANSSV